MPVKYTYNKDENLIFVQASGIITIQEIFEYTEDVSTNPNIKPDFIEIIDLSETIDLNISYSDTLKFSGSWNKWENKGHKGSIMFAPSDINFGIMRMLQTVISFEPGAELVPHLVTKKKGGNSKVNKKTKILTGQLKRVVHMRDQLENNKRNALAFYDLIFNRNKPEEGVEKYVGDEYIQHNPEVGDGKEPFIAYFKRMAKEYPGKKVHFKRIITEGNYVVLHCHQEWPGDNDYAGIDIFRFDNNGKIVEHWDVLQVVPEHSANNNTMF